MRREAGLRLLLVVGSALSVGTGIWAIMWTPLLEGIFGLDQGFSRSGAFDAMARFFGANQVVFGVGYALAAAQPQRNRSLLVLLFSEPLLVGMMFIAAAARGEAAGGNAIGLAAVNLVYCFLFFRFYPRVDRTTADVDQPPDPVK